MRSKKKFIFQALKLKNVFFLLKFIKIRERLSHLNKPIINLSFSSKYTLREAECSFHLAVPSKALNANC